MHRKRISFVTSIPSSIGQAPGRRPILEKRDIESIKATPRVEFYGPIFLLEDTIYDHRLFPSLDSRSRGLRESFLY